MLTFIPSAPNAAHTLDLPTVADETAARAAAAQILRTARKTGHKPTTLMSGAMTKIWHLATGTLKYCL